MTSTGVTNSRFVFWAVLVLFPVLFFVDSATPRGVVVCIAYEPVVCLALWFRGRRSVFILAAVASVLAILGAYLKPQSAVTVWMLVTNRILSIATMWWVATGVYRYRLAADAHKISSEELLRREVDAKKALLATIVEFSDDAILSMSVIGVINSWNGGAEDLFGYTCEEAVGKSVAMLVPTDLSLESVYLLSEIGQGKATKHLETVRLHKSGRRIEVSVTVSPIRDASGTVIGASKCARDITAKK